MMTLDKAIEHAKWCAENSEGECSDEHRQFAEWLRAARGCEESSRWFTARIHDLKAENASLRGAAQGLGELCDKYKAENDRLRDLVRDMSFPYKYGDFDCGLCPHTDRCWDSETLGYSPDGCVILKTMRELGIEV